MSVLKEAAKCFILVGSEAGAESVSCGEVERLETQVLGNKKGEEGITDSDLRSFSLFYALIQELLPEEREELDLQWAVHRLNRKRECSELTGIVLREFLLPLKKRPHEMLSSWDINSDIELGKARAVVHSSCECVLKMMECRGTGGGRWAGQKERDRKAALTWVLSLASAFGLIVAWLALVTGSSLAF